MAPRTGGLELEFRRDGDGRTYLHRQFAAYPFHICRPFYYADDPPGLASLYLQSLAGGIYEGDRLTARVVARAGARAHLTSQAATVVHGMRRDRARYDVVIEAQPQTLVEYMPDPTILFPDASLDSRLTIRADATSVMLLSDAYLFHDPMGLGRPFARLRGETRLETPDGKLLACDRFTIGGRDVSDALPGAMGRYRAIGSLFLVDFSGACEGIVDPLRCAAGEWQGVYAGVSTLPNRCGLWMRLLSGEAHDLQRAMRSAWSVVRRTLYGSEPRERRK